MCVNGWFVQMTTVVAFASRMASNILRQFHLPTPWRLVVVVVVVAISRVHFGKS